MDLLDDLEGAEIVGTTAEGWYPSMMELTQLTLRSKAGQGYTIDVKDGRYLGIKRTTVLEKTE